MSGLSVVKPGDSPKRPKKKSVSEAAASGTQLDLLRAMRERIAKAVEDSSCPPRDLAALTRRLQEIAKEIKALELADQQEVARGERAGDESFDAASL